ncbi:MAG: class I SAM-dependent methyltransferase [Phycisphaerales bacterium]|nr:class I SAM-dependent methyltransferase [Phycisphaerales bacterium]
MSTEVSEHYRGEAGRNYAEARHNSADSPGYDFNFAFFRDHLKSGDRVLDFGCGNGGMLSRIKDFGASPTGLEVNPAAAAMARERGYDVYPDIEELPDDMTFDAIVSNHVLEHVRDPSSTLERLRRQLVPGGRLILKLPVDDFRAGLQRGFSKDDVDHHLHTWTPRLLANTLYEAGYDVKSCSVLTSAWHPKLFWTAKFGLQGAAFWAFAVLKKRRQLLAVSVNPGG